jgi:hypothetical protein
MNLQLKFKLRLKRSTLKKRAANLKLIRKKQLSSPREQRKLLLLNKNHKKTPMKSMNKTLKNCWISPKKKRLFSSNKRN